MSAFPFDGLDLEPTPAQAKLIAAFEEFRIRTNLPEPDIVQPRPTNPGAIEIFWIESKLCVVFEDEGEIAAAFGFRAPPAEAA